MYNLLDTWNETGDTLEGFNSAVRDLAAHTNHIQVTGDRISFYYLSETPKKDDTRFKVIGINQAYIRGYREDISNGFAKNRSLSIPTTGLISENYISPELARESFTKSGFAVAYGADENNPKAVHCAAFAEGAMATLSMRAKIAGERTLDKSFVMLFAIAESLSDSKAPMTLVERFTGGNTKCGKDYKVFAALSGKYEAIPMTILSDVINRLSDVSDMGKPVVKRWYIDQNVAEIQVEFPDVADAFSAEYKLPEKVIPGLLLMSSDTGYCSITIKGTYRMEDQKTHVVVDEYSHKHIGDINESMILDACEKQIFARISRLPNALVEKLGKVIALGNSPDVADIVKSAYESGFRKLGLTKVLGAKRKKAVLEALNLEIDPSVTYTEYDIAQTLMRLPDRIDGLSRELSSRLAKACGGAPFLDFGKTKTEVVLMPEE